LVIFYIPLLMLKMPRLTLPPLPQAGRGAQARLLPGLLLGLLVALAVPSGTALAWSQQDLEAAERIVERQLRDLRAVEAKAQAEAAAQAKAKAGAEAKVARQRRLESNAVAMVKIPGGKYQMGCSPKDKECAVDEKPAHAVTIRPFRLGKYEVTQAQWQAVMGSIPHASRATSGRWRASPGATFRSS
jgi:formylglycine-generating enzyme required for sulfatase activity